MNAKLGFEKFHSNECTVKNFLKKSIFEIIFIPLQRKKLLHLYFSVSGAMHLAAPREEFNFPLT